MSIQERAQLAAVSQILRRLYRSSLTREEPPCCRQDDEDLQCSGAEVQTPGP